MIKVRKNLLPNDVLKKVSNTIDFFVKIGKKYNGLFPSIIDRKTHAMSKTYPPVIVGQRDVDRAYLGSNIIHDVALLKTMYALAKFFKRDDYKEAADNYIKYFANHCTKTATGLFPWGEHAFWHLTNDSVGNGYLSPKNPNSKMKTAIHDHLRQVPIWLWEKIYQFNPTCVENFSDGLKYHWIDGGAEEYTRHAAIEIKQYVQKREKSTDFPRHSGFYILDLSFAYKKFKRTDFLNQIKNLLDYWWVKRDINGLLPLQSRPLNEQVLDPGQTLSLALSLLESAAILNDLEPEIAQTMENRAKVYIEGFNRASNETIEKMPYWNSCYGSMPVAYIALLALCAYRFTGKAFLLKFAKKVGNFYLKTPLPKKLTVPSIDAGLLLSLIADLYDITEEKLWIEKGLPLAGNFIDIYMDNHLPRGACGVDWYDAQLGPSFLIHGLARLALLAIDKNNCVLDADYTVR